MTTVHHMLLVRICIGDHWMAGNRYVRTSRLWMVRASIFVVFPVNTVLFSACGQIPNGVLRTSCIGRVSMIDFIIKRVVCAYLYRFVLTRCGLRRHYSDVIMSAMTCQITSVSIVFSTVCSGADRRKHQSSTSLAIVRGIHRWPVDFPHKGPVKRNMFPFDDIIMRGDKPLSEPTLAYCTKHLSKQASIKPETKYKQFLLRKYIRKCRYMLILSESPKYISG